MPVLALPRGMPVLALLRGSHRSWPTPAPSGIGAATPATRAAAQAEVPPRRTTIAATLTAAWQRSMWATPAALQGHGFAAGAIAERAFPRARPRPRALWQG